jgi:hypothetical protein
MLPALTGAWPSVTAASNRCRVALAGRVTFGKVVPPETLCGIEIWPASIAMTAATMSYLRIVHRWWRAKSCQ